MGMRTNIMVEQKKNSCLNYMKFVFLLFIVLFLILVKLSCFTERYNNFNINHPSLVKKCFSNDEINSFSKYQFSKIVHGSNNKSLCYLTPTIVFEDEIPILSWNGYYINNLCVDSNYRNQGLGRKLLEKVIKNSKKEGKDHLILQVKNKNSVAKNLFYKYDFRDYFKGVNNNNEIVTVMVKFL